MLYLFNTKHIPGYESIPVPIIKHVKLSLLNPLAHVINSSITSGIFPEKFKISKICPFSKNDNLQNVSSYQPLQTLRETVVTKFIVNGGPYFKTRFCRLYPNVSVRNYTIFLEVTKLIPLLSVLNHLQTSLNNYKPYG